MHPDAFRHKLEALMKAKGFNTATLARAAGCSATTVWGIFNRKAEPRRNTLNKIAKALGVPVTELLREDDAPPAFDPVLMSGLIAEMLKQLGIGSKSGIAVTAHQITVLYDSLARRKFAGRTISSRDIAEGVRIIALGIADRPVK